MTFKQMQDRVKFTLGAEEVIGNDEVALIKQFLNDGIVNILTRTRPYTRQITLNLTGGVAIHDMSSAILSLVDVEVPGYGFLQRYTREDITKAQSSGGYGYAYEEPLLWISPISSQDSTITAYGIFRPTALSGDTDDPSASDKGGLNPEFHEAIIVYALWKMAEYVQHEGSGQGEKWRQQYEGQDGTEGQIAWIKRVLAKRVTPKAASRRDLTGNLGSLSGSGSYIGATNGA
jgi:hypothetical protein